jgi:hypothetical protein
MLLKPPKLPSLLVLLRLDTPTPTAPPVISSKDRSNAFKEGRVEHPLLPS